MAGASSSSPLAISTPRNLSRQPQANGAAPRLLSGSTLCDGPRERAPVAGGCSLSSNWAAGDAVRREPQTVPPVREQRPRPAHLLVVPTGRELPAGVDGRLSKERWAFGPPRVGIVVRVSGGRVERSGTARGLDVPARGRSEPRGRRPRTHCAHYEVVLYHDGTSTERKREKPKTSGRGSALQVDHAVLTTTSRAAGTGAARRSTTGLARVESHDGAANCRTRVARASPVSASRRPMAADGLSAFTRPPPAA
jgi:hypothetical protein